MCSLAYVPSLSLFFKSITWKTRKNLLDKKLKERFSEGPNAVLRSFPGSLNTEASVAEVHTLCQMLCWVPGIISRRLDTALRVRRLISIPQKGYPGSGAWMAYTGSPGKLAAEPGLDLRLYPILRHLPMSIPSEGWLHVAFPCLTRHCHNRILYLLLDYHARRAGL